MVPLCLKLDKETEAFEFLEQGKSRAFLDLLAATEIRPSVKVTPELESLLGEEEEYLAKLREIQTQHLRQKKVTIEPGEIDKILEKLVVVYKEIEKSDKEYVFTRRGKTLSLVELQDILTSQKKDIVLIEYFIAYDKVFIFIVSSRNKNLYIEQFLRLYFDIQQLFYILLNNYMRCLGFHSMTTLLACHQFLLQFF
ncbi:unnamed protein product [marine sediment metagenome]|uniref:Uncharacterized protein n=1 Tax=marine sediment metagenome TaxID=412755 RepID=X0Z7J3_9ZZZZ